MVLTEGTEHGESAVPAQPADLVGDEIQFPDENGGAVQRRIAFQFRNLSLRDVARVDQHAGDVRIVDQVDRDGFEPAIVSGRFTNHELDAAFAAAFRYESASERQHSATMLRMYPPDDGRHVEFAGPVAQHARDARTFECRATFDVQHDDQVIRFLSQCDESALAAPQLLLEHHLLSDVVRIQQQRPQRRIGQRVHGETFDPAPTVACVRYVDAEAQATHLLRALKHGAAADAFADVGQIFAMDEGQRVGAQQLLGWQADQIGETFAAEQNASGLVQRTDRVPRTAGNRIDEGETALLELCLQIRLHGDGRCNRLGDVRLQDHQRRAAALRVVCGLPGAQRYRTVARGVLIDARHAGQCHGLARQCAGVLGRQAAGGSVDVEPVAARAGARIDVQPLCEARTQPDDAQFCVEDGGIRRPLRQ